MSARRRLTLGLALLAAIAAFAFGAFSGAPAAAPPPQAQGNAYGHLGLVGVDHAGITVPNSERAFAWFPGGMGCEPPFTFGPFSGVGAILDVDPQAVVEQITHVRCGRSASIELFQSAAPAQRRTPPLNSDYAGHHIAFYVTNLVAAADYLEAKGV